MRYTVILKDKTVFYTEWYEFENNWNDEFHFIIVDNISGQYTTDGQNWLAIEDDHL